MSIERQPLLTIRDNPIDDLSHRSPCSAGILISQIPGVPDNLSILQKNDWLAQTAEVTDSEALLKTFLTLDEMDYFYSAKTPLPIEYKRAMTIYQLVKLGGNKNRVMNIFGFSSSTMLDEMCDIIERPQLISDDDERATFMEAKNIFSTIFYGPDINKNPHIKRLYDEIYILLTDGFTTDSISKELANRLPDYYGISQFDIQLAISYFNVAAISDPNNLPVIVNDLKSRGVSNTQIMAAIPYLTITRLRMISHSLIESGQARWEYHIPLDISQRQEVTRLIEEAIIDGVRRPEDIVTKLAEQGILITRSRGESVLLSMIERGVIESGKRPKNPTTIYLEQRLPACLPTNYTELVRLLNRVTERFYVSHRNLFITGQHIAHSAGYRYLRHAAEFEACWIRAEVPFIIFDHSVQQGGVTAIRRSYIFPYQAGDIAIKTIKNASDLQHLKK